MVKFLLFLLLCAPAFSAEFTRASCVIHVHSDFSGRQSKKLSQIIQEAKEKKIDAIITTDHDIMRWEYGVWPLRNIFKAVRSENSVLKLGPRNYLDEIKRLGSENPQIIIIPGIESSPFYYWTGNPIKKSLTLNSWHKHVIIAGLYNEADYYALPLVSNHGAGKFDGAKLWPVLIITAGILLRNKKKYSYILIIFGALFLANNYPYRSFGFNQYAGAKGDEPYQELVNYANAKGALTFLAHPEARNYNEPIKLGPVYAVTNPYPESVSNISGLTGFGAFSEGYNTTLNPDGGWDKALVEYCAGKRDRPLWGIGELDYGEASFKIDDIVNILWLRGKNRKSVMDALANGNFFILWQQDKKWNLALDGFSVKSGNNMAICGQEINYHGPVRVSFTIAATDNISHTVNIKIIKNGRVEKIIESQTPSNIIYEDTDAPAKGAKYYYRAIIESGYPRIIATNPVFING